MALGFGLCCCPVICSVLSNVFFLNTPESVDLALVLVSGVLVVPWHSLTAAGPLDT